MQKMIVTKFVIGKTVAQDIYTGQGFLLLKAGHKLTETMVVSLAKYNVVTIWVE
ncbi:hypothetical protein [Cohnella abietis]|uniref:Uncharacterized protein n=1 Tax=Cohnella abietis TaxID=2507935 RepID=A0A3T1DET3_9BACL|nr:hypothetical protein [Cohnella abietis]BBI36609.1 hypothetical protein KCTCHS21_60080 [Cohnella abietis]